MQKFLIIGLGNIGDEYAHTRHNIGFDVVDAFASKHAAVFQLERLAYVSRLGWRGKQVILIKPTTFMNLSGKAVKYWMDHEKIPLEQVLVVVDELAIPLNRVRLRPSGSAAGHNGLISIGEALATEQYPRLRFGIGNDFPRGGQVDYVLGNWTAAQLPLVNLKIEKCVQIIESFLQQGLARTMNDWNKIAFEL